MGLTTPSGNVVVSVGTEVDPSGAVVEVVEVGSTVVLVVDEPSGSVDEVVVVDVGSCADVTGPNATVAARHTTSVAASARRFIVPSAGSWRS
jgi:hypothetical protein